MKCTQSICAIVCLICLSNSLAAASSSRRSEEIAAIQTYCKSVDRFIRRNPKTLRIFADVASATKPKPDWRQFKSEKKRQQVNGDLNENAYVWTRQGKIIGANFMFQSESRDWANYVMYYYREDGSLAKITAELRTFYGRMSVVREQLYDPTGRRIASSKKYYDLHTGEKKKPDGDFIDESFPVYKTTTALPFYAKFFATRIDGMQQTQWQSRREARPGSAGILPACLQQDIY